MLEDNTFLHTTMTSNKLYVFAGYFVSCASGNISVALSVGPTIVIPFLLFGGYFLNVEWVLEYIK